MFSISYSLLTHLVVGAPHEEGRLQLKVHQPAGPEHWRLGLVGAGLPVGPTDRGARHHHRARSAEKRRKTNVCNRLVRFLGFIVLRTGLEPVPKKSNILSKSHISFIFYKLFYNK